jgi:hypothetical protein
MARAGQGEPFVVLRPEKAAAEAEKLRAYIEQPVLAHVGVSFVGLDAYEVAPQKLPDLMARRPLVLFGKYRGQAAGRIEVSGVSGGGKWRQSIDARPANVRAENAALRWLWARRWVDVFEDERAMGAGTGAEEGITALGLDYKLLTAFTSFVAVDSQVVNQGGNGKSVRQPLPMPEGVSNLAVAESAAPTPTMMGFKAKKEGGGRGYGSGAMGSFGRAEAPASAPIAMSPPPPSPAPVSRRRAASDDERRVEAKPGKQDISDSPLGGLSKDAAPTPRWKVTVGKTASVGTTTALVETVRSLLGSRRAGCVAAIGQPLQLRLTVDAHGKIVRVDVIGGDRALEACVRGLLSGRSSATFAQGAPTGTVEVTITK